MRISAKAQYACLAVIELAQSRSEGAPRRVREIAKAQGIPAAYLIQILLRLKAAGLVQSARGPIGGYQLARSPSEISVGEVIDAIEVRSDPPGTGGSSAACNLATLLARIDATERAILSSATIAELAQQVEPQDVVF
jgi:Rrf2 family cysteine metabolism transcriptional repressor